MQLARIRTFEDLRRACAAQRKRKGMSQRTVDAISGLQDGYIAKLEAGIKRPGDMSLPIWLESSRVALVAVDLDLLDASKQTEPPMILDGYTELQKKSGGKGGRARGAKLSRARKREIARLGAQQKHENWKKNKRRELAAEKRRAIAEGRLK